MGLVIQIRSDTSTIDEFTGDKLDLSIPIPEGSGGQVGKIKILASVNTPVKNNLRIAAYFKSVAVLIYSVTINIRCPRMDCFVVIVTVCWPATPIPILVRSIALHGPSHAHIAAQTEFIKALDSRRKSIGIDLQLELPVVIQWNSSEYLPDPSQENIWAPLASTIAQIGISVLCNNTLPEILCRLPAETGKVSGLYGRL